MFLFHLSTTFPGFGAVHSQFTLFCTDVRNPKDLASRDRVSVSHSCTLFWRWKRPLRRSMAPSACSLLNKPFVNSWPCVSKTPLPFRDPNMTPWKIYSLPASAARASEPLLQTFRRPGAHSHFLVLPARGCPTPRNLWLR